MEFKETYWLPLFATVDPVATGGDEFYRARRDGGGDRQIIFAAMGDMFEALDQDEAMLFLVPQLANQGGINGMMYQLLTHRTAANWPNRTFDFVLGCGNNRERGTLFLS